MTLTISVQIPSARKPKKPSGRERDDADHDRRPGEPARQHARLQCPDSGAEQEGRGADGDREEHVHFEHVQGLQRGGADVVDRVPGGEGQAGEDRRADGEDDSSREAEVRRDAAPGGSRRSSEAIVVAKSMKKNAPRASRAAPHCRLLSFSV